jgi:hypothetical protein
MTRLRFKDLSPKLQAQVKAVDPSGAVRRSARAGKVRTVAPEGKAVWRCIPCGVEFTAYATVQTHIDTAHGGGRIAFVLPTDQEGHHD